MIKQLTTNSADRTANLGGSVWHRWDPHIHAPGTQKADKFDSTEDVLDRYVASINECDPPIRALGITDYLVLDSYKEILRRSIAGELPGVDLVFANIELRFAINAGKGSPINVHLLVNPKDSDHVERIERFLAELKFDFQGEDYGCTKAELIRLGYAFRKNVENERHALRLGVEQSKITPQNLNAAFKKSKWARQNVLVALDSGSSQGVSQLQEDGLKALREELQRASHIIFSANPKDRDYWCGNGVDSIEELKNKYGSLKPCLHGSDAHEMDDIGKPEKDRFCWMRGDVTFETLQQVCFEPAGRVHIGPNPPSAGRSSNTIRSVGVANASWMKTSSLAINDGLVAIVGARGSGKTALVEMIAAGANSVDKSHAKRSFLDRAKNHLIETRSTLKWGNGEETSDSVHLPSLLETSEAPRVRYLSQQFVDQLCSSDGLADELVEAIEDVIFAAHPPDARLGAQSFRELRELKTQSVHRRITHHREQLRSISEEISEQDELKRGLLDLQKMRDADAAAIGRLKTDRIELTPTENKDLLEDLEAVRQAAERKSQAIAHLERRDLKLSSLREEAKQFRDDEAAVLLDRLKEDYREACLNDSQWSAFKLKHEGDVDAMLQAQLTAVRAEIIDNKGPQEGEVSEVPVEDLSSSPSLIPAGAGLESLTYSLLLKEQARLEAKIGVDADRRKRYLEISGKISRAESALGELERKIENAHSAKDKIDQLLERRQKSYLALLKEIDAEEKALTKLYKPLQDRLQTENGTLGSLVFSVRRLANVSEWAEAGERLFDRSRQGPFQGIGSLTARAEEGLSDVWADGDAEEIAAAMAKFRETYGSDFWKHAFRDALKSPDSRKTWFAQVSDWLYSTDHVSVTYGLEYEGLDIAQLSPGTRGIVLLLLYLSIDVDDERPLVIDQPEENLDPESIYKELVGRFKEAKTRRQIIIVTHNANLVVNTDADQVIVARRGVHHANALPDISYVSGGLENPDIRKAVCDILEGGKDAFTERAKRLRIEFGEV